MSDPAELLARNRAWAARMVSEDAHFFTRLVAQQAPRFLWIGCSDSRVPANVIAGLEPGEVFVHRNVANVVDAEDRNAMTVLEYAVSVLGVEHVIVCGHYGCGGVAAALDGQAHGRLDAWLRHIKDVADLHPEALAACADDACRTRRLAELNALEQARHTAETTLVREAWAAGATLSVRAWIYGLRDGLLRDLGFVAHGPDEVEPAYRKAVAGRGRHP